jgi:hypothetical protein
VLRLAPGELTVGFSDVAPHCSLSSPTPVPLTVSAGDTATVAFAVTCRELPSIRATVQTTGSLIDDAMTIRVCDWSYYGTCQSQTVPSNGAITFPRMSPGRYSVSISDVADNCASTGRSWVEVEVQGSDVVVAFEITCQAFATVRVSVATTGTNQDLAYRVVHETWCDNWYYVCPEQGLPSPGSVDFRTLPGMQTFRLVDVADNCTVVAPGNPATVTALEAATVDVRFEVVCQ